MTADTQVACSGVVYSSLMSDQFNYLEIQEGFLLGSTVQHTSTRISDADINQQTTTNTIHITSYHTLELLGCLYDSNWSVREQTIENVVRMANENKQKVLGWYVKRCYTDSWDRVYLRERLVHQQLREKLNSPDFVFIIINSRNSQSDCTTNYFLNIWRDNKFCRFPLKIGNLGNTSSTDYKLDPPNPALYKSPALVNQVNQLQRIEEGVVEATALHEKLDNALVSQLTTLSSIEHLRNARSQQLVALRSTCYLNNIVPEYELPYSINQEKPEEISNQSNNGVTVKKSKEISSDEEKVKKQTKQVTPKDKRLHSPAPKNKSDPRSKSPCVNKSLDGVVEGLDSDMNKLSVIGIPNSRKTPLKKRDELRSKLNSVKSASSSPAGRGQNVDSSTHRRYGSVTNMSRQSRSPSVGSVKRKLSASSKNTTSSEETSSKVWK